MIAHACTVMVTAIEKHENWYKMLLLEDIKYNATQDDINKKCM